MTWRGDSRPPTAHRSASCWCHSAGSDECRCLKAAVPSSIEAGLKLSGSGRWAKNERKNHRNGKRTKRALPSRKCGNRQSQHMSKAPNSGPFWNLLVPRARARRGLQLAYNDQRCGAKISRPLSLANLGACCRKASPFGRASARPKCLANQANFASARRATDSLLEAVARTAIGARQTAPAPDKETQSRESRRPRRR